jgi:hypothetical protein
VHKLSLWYQINKVPSHNLARKKEPERLESSCTTSKHVSDSDWHRWTKATQNMFWVRPYFHFLNYLLWVFYYCLNKNENHCILSTDIYQKKKNWVGTLTATCPLTVIYLHLSVQMNTKKTGKIEVTLWSEIGKYTGEHTTKTQLNIHMK